MQWSRIIGIICHHILFWNNMSHIILIILFNNDYCDYCRSLRFSQIIVIIAIIRIIVTMVLKHRRFHHKHHWNVLQVTWHTTLCYLCMLMDCHVIFRSIRSCSFVQTKILYVGFLNLNRGFPHFSDAGDDIARHSGKLHLKHTYAMDTLHSFKHVHNKT